MFAARKNGIKELDSFHLMATSIYCKIIAVWWEILRRSSVSFTVKATCNNEDCYLVEFSMASFYLEMRTPCGGPLK